MKCFLYPDIGRVDEPLQLHMDGLIPNEQINLKLKLNHPKLGLFTSELLTAADKNGKLTISNHGKNEFSTLLWDLRCGQEIEESSSLSTEALDPLQLHIDIEAIESSRVESRTITRLFMEDHVSQNNVSTEFFRGSYFYPKGLGELPTIIVLGSGDGEMRHDIAALLASQGYGALTIAYLKKNSEAPLAEVPVDYIYHAVEWLRNNPTTDGKNIIIYGISKGAELALLAASKNKYIRGAVAISPASHVFQGLNSKKRSSSWTESGRPLAYVPYSFTFKDFLKRFASKFLKKDLLFNELYTESLLKYERKGKTEAIIKVENIQGPILLISGGVDTFWPSEIMAEKIVDRLKEHQFKFPLEHYSFKNAGHSFIQPYLPAFLGTDSVLKGGGNPMDNAISGEQAWIETLRFLNQQFPPAELPTESYTLQPTM